MKSIGKVIFMSIINKANGRDTVRISNGELAEDSEVCSEHLFGAIGEKLVQTREKPPHFCEDFFSLIYVWSGGRDSNSRHSAWKADALPAELPPQSRTENSPNYVLNIPFLQLEGW